MMKKNNQNLKKQKKLKTNKNYFKWKIKMRKWKKKTQSN